VAQTAKERGSAGTELLEARDYLGAAGRPHRSGPTIAMIYGTGTIQRGSNGVDPLSGGTSMGSDDIAKAFREAAEDPDVRAILFRIDSGGGSAVASESIRRALVKAKAAGKPVIVSMGEAAASGGYWIAMNADKIIAHPGTLTGSVGVVAGKMVTSGLWSRFGIEWGQVSRGRNANIWSSLTPYSEDESKRLDTILDDIYGAFVRNIAEARKLPVASVRDIAKGRVWTGAQAKALGLVDELGDMETALGFAREAAGLPRDADITLQSFPKPEPQWMQALDLITGRSETRSVSAVLTEIRPMLRELCRLARDPARDTLTMPPTGLLR
jgi:protease-4